MRRTEGKYIELPDGTPVWAVWREETQEWIAVRKIMPIEAMRLQGVPDKITNKLIDAGISDTQLFRSAGDGVTIPVVEAIARKMISIWKEENAIQETEIETIRRPDPIAEGIRLEPNSTVESTGMLDTDSESEADEPGETDAC